jgi:hypothetical protein
MDALAKIGGREFFPVHGKLGRCLSLTETRYGQKSENAEQPEIDVVHLHHGEIPQAANSSMRMALFKRINTGKDLTVWESAAPAFAIEIS